jgi:hypothetical protein
MNIPNVNVARVIVFILDFIASLITFASQQTNRQDTCFRQFNKFTDSMQEQFIKIASNQTEHMPSNNASFLTNHTVLTGRKIRRVYRLLGSQRISPTRKNEKHENF